MNSAIILEKNEEHKYNLVANGINIIKDSYGDLYFPEGKELSQLQIIFTQQGKFNLYWNALEVGLTQTEKFTTYPGRRGYDVNPSFILIDNKWVYIGMGNFELPEKKND